MVKSCIIPQLWVEQIYFPLSKWIFIVINRLENKPIMRAFAYFNSVFFIVPFLEYYLYIKRVKMLTKCDFCFKINRARSFCGGCWVFLMVGSTKNDARCVSRAKSWYLTPQGIRVLAGQTFSCGRVKISYLNWIDPPKFKINPKKIQIICLSMLVMVAPL